MPRRRRGPNKTPASREWQPGNATAADEDWRLNEQKCKRKIATLRNNRNVSTLQNELDWVSFRYKRDWSLDPGHGLDVIRRACPTRAGSQEDYSSAVTRLNICEENPQVKFVLNSTGVFQMQGTLSPNTQQVFRAGPPNIPVPYNNSWQSAQLFQPVQAYTSPFQSSPNASIPAQPPVANMAASMTATPYSTIGEGMHDLDRIPWNNSQIAIPPPNSAIAATPDFVMPVLGLMGATGQAEMAPANFSASQNVIQPVDGMPAHLALANFAPVSPYGFNTQHHNSYSTNTHPSDPGQVMEHFAASSYNHGGPWQHQPQVVPQFQPQQSQSQAAQLAMPLQQMHQTNAPLFAGDLRQPTRYRGSDEVYMTTERPVEEAAQTLVALPVNASIPESDLSTPNANSISPEENENVEDFGFSARDLELTDAAFADNFSNWEV